MPNSYSLADGVTVWATNRFEASVLYREMFVERSYFRHGITLPPDAMVMDVGANIGMFGLYLARHHPGATVHMFEPVPATFALLARNMASAGTALRAHLHDIGLAETAGTVTFEVDSQVTFAASMRPDAVEGSRRDSEASEAWAEAVIRDLPRIAPGSRAARAAVMGLRWPPVRRVILAVTGLLLRIDARARTRRLRTIECRVARLGDVIREHGIERIDLLKIDVEGAELDVIAGLDDADWPRIRQLVAEVHDVDGRVEQMAAMLRGRGYDVVVEPEEWAVHRLLGITTLFARLPSGGSGTAEAAWESRPRGSGAADLESSADASAPSPAAAVPPPAPPAA